jgi:hypothetical protein
VSVADFFCCDQLGHQAIEHLESIAIDCTKFGRLSEFDQSQQRNLRTLFLYPGWEVFLTQNYVGLEPAASKSIDFFCTYSNNDLSFLEIDFAT